MSTHTIGDHLLVATVGSALTPGEIFSWPRFVRTSPAELRQFVVSWDDPSPALLPKVDLPPVRELTNRHGRRKRAAELRKK